MRHNSLRNLDLPVAMLEITAGGLEEIEWLGGHLVAQLLRVIDIVSANADDIASGLSEILSHFRLGSAVQFTCCFSVGIVSSFGESDSRPRAQNSYYYLPGGRTDATLQPTPSTSGIDNAGP
jgi:hypothetical protein